ncbi:MAG: hypothetical protein K0S32_1212 [Bacteroidetes bacterium]|jgi:hypothetical protein|nr:hypothetical protein [Bacteroidota bacterium]
MKLLFKIAALTCLTTISVAQPITGSGTGSGVGGPIPRFNGANNITGSMLYQNGINVGLGTTTPTNPLHIQTTSSAGYGLLINQLGNGQSGINLWNTNSTTPGKNWGIWSTGPGNAEGAGHFIIKDVTGSANRLFISGTNGRIGIGTSAPNAALDVNGDAKVATDLTVGGDVNVLGSTQFNSDLFSTQLSGTGNRFVYADPTGKLIPGNPVITSVAWDIGGNSFGGSSSQIIGTTTNDDFEMRTNNLSRMFLDRSGKIIGGDHPGYIPLDEDFMFNQNSATSKLMVTAQGLDGTSKPYKSTVGAANMWGSVELIQEKSGQARLATDGNDAMFFKNGQVVVGNSAQSDYIWPSTRFNVRGSASTGQTAAIFESSGEATGYANTIISMSNPNAIGLALFTGPNPGPFYTSAPVMSLFGSGKIALSINPSVSADAFEVKDAVAGKVNFKVKTSGFVYAREVNVWASTLTFPDYVFSKEYKLKTLAELESYIKDNQHLPNIPSAKEVEENGMNLAELQVKQMEKIEELTLYIIELEKRIKSLEKNK